MSQVIGTLWVPHIIAGGEGGGGGWSNFKDIFELHRYLPGAFPCPLNSRPRSHRHAHRISWPAVLVLSGTLCSNDIRSRVKFRFKSRYRYFQKMADDSSNRQVLLSVEAEAYVEAIETFRVQDIGSTKWVLLIIMELSHRTVPHVQFNVLTLNWVWVLTGGADRMD